MLFCLDIFGTICQYKRKMTEGLKKMARPKLLIARTADGADFPLPSYESRYHTGMRLSAAISQTVKIDAGERLRVPVGFAVGIPDGFSGLVVSWPQMAADHGIVVSDAPHVINPADRGPLFVLLHNLSPTQFILRRGDIIAQLLTIATPQPAWQEVDVSQKNATETPTAALFLDEEGPAAEKKADTHSAMESTRRVKRSIRERYKKVDASE